MKNLLTALGALLLSVICLHAWAEEANSVQILNTNIYNSCAPWDAAAVDIVVETIDVTIHLYNDDIANLKSGKAVTVNISNDNMVSSAVIKDPSSALGWKPVSVEIKVNIKKLKGYLVIDGSVHPLAIHWDAAEHAICG